MRNVPLLAVGAGFLLVVCTVPANWASGQTEIQLVTFTTPWKYYLTNSSGPPGAWTATNYQDSSWFAGVPLFGADDYPGSHYPVTFGTAITPPGGGGPLTLYFRTHFSLPANSLPPVVLVASNLLDDGAVFYLNGAEVQRIRMPLGAVTYNTFAENQPNEGGFETFTIPATNVHAGDNVVAVELHNTSTYNADAVFGISLTAVLPSPLQIVSQPGDQIVSEAQPATFTVGVTGSDPQYQWYTNGVGVPRAVGPTYLLLSPKTNQSGMRIHAVVTNPVGAVTSAVVMLTVLKDIYPPGLVSAVAQDGCNAFGCSNSVRVTFTENVLAVTATNRANYVITRVGTAQTVSVSNVLQSGKDLTLIVGRTNWIWGGEYLLTVRGVADAKTNYVSPLSNQVVVAFPEVLVAWNATSLCSPLIGDVFPPPLIEPATNWMQPDFDDTDPGEWDSVVGIVTGGTLSPVPSCSSVGSWRWPYSSQPRYFRTHFTVSENPGRNLLRLRVAIADGAVFHLNGREIYRYNMPLGPIEWATPALIVEPSICKQTTNLFTQSLRSGDNVLAVEVHSVEGLNGNNFGFYYGTELSVVWLPDPIVFPRPCLKIAPAAGNRVRLDWPADTGLDWTLEATADLTSGPWIPVATHPPFQTNLAPGTSQFFRLRGPGPF